jgi:hypothetical protein
VSLSSLPPVKSSTRITPEARRRIYETKVSTRLNEELLMVPGAGHVDPYDRAGLIPWETSGIPRHATGRSEGGI